MKIGRNWALQNSSKKTKRHWADSVPFLDFTTPQSQQA